MRRLLKAGAAVAQSALLRQAGMWLLVTVASCPAAFGQANPTAEYRAYPLRHKAVADVEKMLGEMLSDLGAATHLIVDTRNNQLLLRGPAEAQQIARQLIDSVDRPQPVEPEARSPVRPEARSPVWPEARSLVRPYPCEGSRLAEVADRLRAQYAGSQGVRIATDPQTARLLILAPPEVHAAIPQALAALGVAGPPSVPVAVAQPEPPWREEFVSLAHSQVARVEPMLRDLFPTRLQRLKVQPVGQVSYQFTSVAGGRVELSVDRRRNGVMVSGAGALVGQLARLIRVLDNLQQGTAGATVRVVPVRNADPAKVRQAVEAYRSGYRQGRRLRRAAPAPDRQGAVVPLYREPYPHEMPQPSRFTRGGMEFVAYMFQPADAPGGGQAGAPTGIEPIPPTEKEPEELLPGLRQMESDVEVDVLPDLDVIILRGRDREVEELQRIIEEIERLSAEVEPVIDVYPLKHVDGTALSQIIFQVNPDLIGGRQGRVSVWPLVKPNALLLIGWGEAVKAVKQLIRKLDQPVPPQTQLRVFHLRHAAATVVQNSVQGFFSSRGGLGPTALVIADPRTNSLIVRAAPRDMAELSLLIEGLDRAETEAVTRARIFKLKNSLAVDLGGILQGAISAARGGGFGQKSAALELLTVDAEQQQVIKSGILNDVQVLPDPRTNTLVVMAPVESMELVAALIEQLDSPAAVAQIKVFKIVNGDANDLILMLRTLLPATVAAAAGTQLAVAEGETSLVPVRFSVNTRTNSIIATGSKGDLQIVEALLLRLDQDEGQRRKNTVYRLKNAPALDVANAISAFLRSERQVAQAAPGTISPFQQIEREVVVVPEPVSNSLILSATPRFFEDIMDLVEQLDAEPAQVMIQVIIAEVKLNNNEEFGVELGLQDSILFDRSLLEVLDTITTSVIDQNVNGSTTTTSEEVVSANITPGFAFGNSPLGNAGSTRALERAGQTAGQALSSFAVGRASGELGYGGLVLSASSRSVSVLIRALQESRRLEVLSRPQVMTLDNQQAFVQVGEMVPRITSSTPNQVGQTNEVVLDDVGLILAVTPRISPDGKVVMELDATKSDVGPVQEGIPVSAVEGVVIRSPRFNITQIQTTVAADSGETVVLGGMISKSKSEVRRRVPFLSEIPILGHLFRFDGDVAERTEMLIILTPHVVRSPKEAERIKQAEAARMHWCLADVNEIHGPTGIYDRSQGLDGHRGTEVIYPDTNPRGTVPEEPQPLVPGEPSRPNPELIPPGQGPGVPAETPPGAPLPPLSPGRILRSGPSGLNEAADQGFVQPMSWGHPVQYGPPPPDYRAQPVPAGYPAPFEGMIPQGTIEPIPAGYLPPPAPVTPAAHLQRTQPLPAGLSYTPRDTEKSRYAAEAAWRH